MPDPVGICASASPKLNYDMSQIPLMRKCLLLTWHGICVIGSCDSESRDHYAAWSPLPDRDKEAEKLLTRRIG